jgi:putative membrane protein
MQTLSQKFLTEDEKNRVTEAVKNAELRTSGEIVPMIVSASHEYPKARIIAALFFSIPSALLLCHLLATIFWLDPDNLYFFFCLFIPLYIIFYLTVSHFPILTKPFIAKAEMDEEVREEATKSFFSERLYKTQGANGILLFISVFESKVWILADYGIQEKVEQNTWQTLIDDLTARISGDNRCDAICECVDSIGNILQTHFPYKRDDSDELHNLIIK